MKRIISTWERRNCSLRVRAGVLKKQSRKKKLNDYLVHLFMYMNTFKLDHIPEESYPWIRENRGIYTLFLD